MISKTNTANPQLLTVSETRKDLTDGFALKFRVIKKKVWISKAGIEKRYIDHLLGQISYMRFCIKYALFKSLIIVY